MLFIQSVALLASLASATSFQAWTGDRCNAAAGSRVTVHGGGSCEEVSGRHSWSVSGDNVKGFYYSGGGCQGNSYEFHANADTCNTINHGDVRSMCVVGKSHHEKKEHHWLRNIPTDPTFPSLGAGNHGCGF